MEKIEMKNTPAIQLKQAIALAPSSLPFVGKACAAIRLFPVARRFYFAFRRKAFGYWDFKFYLGFGWN